VAPRGTPSGAGRHRAEVRAAPWHPGGVAASRPPRAVPADPQVIRPEVAEDH